MSTELKMEMQTEGQKEAAIKKSLGDIGEMLAMETLEDCKFEKIENLNREKKNKEFADIYCEKTQPDGTVKRYVVSVKTRNKYQRNKKINSSYVLGNKAYMHAMKVAEEKNAEPYWMAIQFDEHTYSVYFGSMESLWGCTSISVIQCAKGVLGEILVKDKPHNFDYEYLKNN